GSASMSSRVGIGRSAANHSGPRTYRPSPTVRPHRSADDGTGWRDAAPSPAGWRFTRGRAYCEAAPVTGLGANMIYDSILGTIGRTPIVRINRLAPQHVTMYVKCEFFNPLSSVKDRLAIAIIE